MLRHSRSVQWPDVYPNRQQLVLCSAAVAGYLRPRLARLGRDLRLVFAIFRNSPSLMEEAMPREAPRSELLERLPRFAARAAPAAICCFLDFAGMITCYDGA